MTNPCTTQQDEKMGRPTVAAGLPDAVVNAADSRRSPSHTPGPWSIENPGPRLGYQRIVGPDGQPIAKVQLPGFGVVETDNAHLIAAAPALRDALRDAMPTLAAEALAEARRNGPKSRDGLPVSTVHQDRANAARAALSRLDGAKS